MFHVRIADTWTVYQHYKACHMDLPATTSRVEPMEGPTEYAGWRAQWRCPNGGPYWRVLLEGSMEGLMEGLWEGTNITKLAIVAS